MVTFGFSAFLKLLCLNERPQRTELTRRLLPSSGGYDFHRSLRRHAREFLVDGAPIASVLASAESITRPAERESAVAGLGRLGAWRREMPGPIVPCAPVVYESPNNIFRVRFEPDFGVRRDGRCIAFHIWNTMRPPLAPALVRVALSLVAAAYDDIDDSPDDVAVLSVREPATEYIVGAASDVSTLAAAVVERIENGLGGGGGGAPRAPEDRPRP